MRLRVVLPLLAGALVAPALLAVPAAAAADDLTVVQLAVGQNDAGLFRGPCGEVALLDAGVGAADDIAGQLADWNATGLAWVAATHYDADHIGDIADLQVTVPVVYDRGGGAAAKDTATYDAYYAYAQARTHTALDIGAQLTLCAGEVTFTVLSAGTDGTAAGGVTVTEENDRGLCFLVEYGDFDMATCGDLNGSNEGARTDVETPVAPALGDVEVLKVNHHGSAYSSNATLVSTVKPNLSIISVGRNSHGHPDAGVVSRLGREGDVVTTQNPNDGSMVDGDITITTSGTGTFRLATGASGATATYGLDEAGGAMPTEPDPEPAPEPEPEPDAVVAPAQARPDGITRFAGADRFATAASVSSGSFPGTANDVFIVTGLNWPDALAAGAAAAQVNGPVLPVQAGSIPASISTELTRLQPRRAWIVGGPAAVSGAVVGDLQARGIAVQRISGADRYATAAAVAAQFFAAPAGAYYASGENYADALGGGAAAAARGWPLLLTASGSVPAATPRVGTERIALGGPVALSDTVVAQLGARRVSGADRYATAAAIARDAFPTATTVYVATGLNFPDALAGTPAAGRDRGPILLAASGCVTQATRDAASALGSTSRVALGGTTVVSDSAADLTVCAAPTPVPAPEPEPQPEPEPAKPANPGDTKNCSDFGTQREAQAYFDYYYPHYGDVARLDGNGDLVACESLP